MLNLHEMSIPTLKERMESGQEEFYSNCSKILNIFFFCSQAIYWLSGLEFTIYLVRVANREGPGQTASSEAI